VTTPALTPDFAARCREVCPGFEPVGAVRRARKSELLPGVVRGEPVIAKRLLRPSAVWEWYFAREVAVYRAFDAAPPTFRVPRRYAVADDVLVIERGAPLASLRRPYAALAAAELARLDQMLSRIAGHPLPIGPLPTPEVTRQLHQRLLEDPTDVTWIRDGLARCRLRGLIEDHDLGAAHQALDRDGPTAPGHGDVLLRNVMRTTDQDLVLIDWECAGTYVTHWDRALLWTQLAAPGRIAIEERYVEEPLRALLACVMFALCRELVFLDAFRTPEDHAGRRRVRADLDEVCRRLSG
jgi:hypothetical protein